MLVFFCFFFCPSIQSHPRVTSPLRDLLGDLFLNFQQMTQDFRSRWTYDWYQDEIYLLSIYGLVIYMRHNPFLRPSRLKSLSEAYWNTHSLNWRFAIRNGSPSCVSGTPGVKRLEPEHDHIAKDIETVRGLYASYSGVCVYMITSIMFKFIIENSPS